MFFNNENLLNITNHTDSLIRKIYIKTAWRRHAYQLYVSHTSNIGPTVKKINMALCKYREQAEGKGNTTALVHTPPTFT